MPRSKQASLLAPLVIGLLLAPVARALAEEPGASACAAAGAAAEDACGARSGAEAPSTPTAPRGDHLLVQLHRSLRLSKPEPPQEDEDGSTVDDELQVVDDGPVHGAPEAAGHDQDGHQRPLEACGADVRRRRRADTMCSCRRRTGASNLEPGWTCAGSSIAPCGDDCPMGWPADTGVRHGVDTWCEIGTPHPNWNLKSCPFSGAGTTTVKVLTYNLYWWNLFDKHGGRDRSAGRKIAQTSGPEEYDFMGFQECDDRWRVIREAKAEGLSGDYAVLDGGHAIAMAYRTSRWELLAHGTEDVGEDDSSQYYGTRVAMWARLRHTDGLVAFFVNHHGPLPVSVDGGCAGTAAALNILKLIAGNAHAGDAIILVGDFNAREGSSRVGELDSRLHRVYTGVSHDGVDHIYSNCLSNMVRAENHGPGGSDHDALSVTFTF